MYKIFIAILISSLLFSCKSKNKEKVFDEDGYETSKETLAQKEKNNPARFLQVTNRDRKNLIGQTVIIGHFTNNATLCTYKDVQIKLTFFSKTGTLLDEGIETIYETISPGKKVKFKTKYFSPKGTDSVAIKILSAIGEINQ
ncbi:MAG: hypothetical protein KF781_01960 [Chitinophagaceae bacterium]|nr:hypothetical protein [Chitinophagaceae bacterium]MCW5904273.1 hypothetical protein [Chitinophagaceae bacterium]